MSTLDLEAALREARQRIECFRDGVFTDRGANNAIARIDAALSAASDEASGDEPELAFSKELARARQKFSPMASAHEGYAVIAEEMDELWEIVKQKQNERDYAALRKEVIQLGAMVLAFLTEIVDTENRR